MNPHASLLGAPATPSAAPLASPPRLLTLGTLALAGASATHALGPRKLALLAYLAFASRPLTRDHLAELFWGERDDVRARHSLREALSALRQTLGGEAIRRGTDRIALDDSFVLDVDLARLRAASAAGDAARVVALYAGPFFDGVHVGASSAFEDWVDAQRRDAARHFVEACAAECRRMRDAGEWDGRAALARRWLAAAPLDPKPARILLRSVAAPDTRESLRLAGTEYERLAARLVTDFDVAPDASVAELADAHAARLAAWVEPRDERDPARASERDAEPPTIRPDAADAPAPELVVPPPSPPPADGGPLTTAPRRTRRTMIAAVGAAALACVAGVALVHHGVDARARSAAPVVAILPIAGSRGASDDAWLADAVPKLLADALGRAADVEVVDLTSLGGVRAPALDRAEGLDAARRAGATVAVSATLDATRAGYLLRLDARDTRDPTWHYEAVVSDTVVFTLAERAAVELAGALGAPGASHLAGVQTRSVEAYRAYLDALRLTAEGRAEDATRALDRAIATDSGFVTAVAERRRRMARPMGAAADDSARRLVAVFARNVGRATPYDRADFEAMIAFYGGDHVRAERLAADLAARYPHDPRATQRYIDALTHHGRFADAIAVTRRVLAGDSAARGGPCSACVDRSGLAWLLLLDGQWGEAEAAARDAVVRAPDRPGSWSVLSAALAARERWDEALAAAERAKALAPRDHNYAFEPERRLVEAGRYDEAARRLRPWLAAGDGELAMAAADVEAARLRELGRHAEAVRVLDAGLRRVPALHPVYDLVRGASLAAGGDAAAAATAYATIAAPRAVSALTDDNSWRHGARAFAWPRALMADALFVAGEANGRPVNIRRLTELADSVEVVGATSYYGRDWRLHHHLRALVAAREGRWADAAAGFRRARWGRVGWTRTLVELARAELATGRPDSALAALRDARTSVLDGMGRYATRSDVDLWTARAFAAAGQRDSARFYAARVRKAWAAADPAERRQLATLPR